MQYIALSCAPMFIPMLIISFQVKSFNDGILLVDPAMSFTCAMCTSGTRHMPSSHCGHLLIIPPSHANTFFNICLCIILNTYFLTDCLTAIYYIMLYYFSFTLICFLPFLLSSLLITSQERGGCYPGLTSMTQIHD